MHACLDDISLKEVRNLTWDVYPMWEDLGIELELPTSSLEVSV